MLKTLFGDGKVLTNMGARLDIPGLDLGHSIGDHMTYGSERNTTLNMIGGPTLFNDWRKRNLA
jgi:hypothetical protein